MGKKMPEALQRRSKRPPRRLGQIAKARKLETAKRMGILDAEYKWSNLQKGWMDSLRKHIGKAIDRINPMETAAVLGATYFIKQGVKWSDTIVARATFGLEAEISFFERMFVRGEGVLSAFFSTLREKTAAGKPETWDEGFLKEWQEWIAAFVIAYIVVHNFGQLVEAGGNLVGFATAFLAKA